MQCKLQYFHFVTFSPFPFPYISQGFFPCVFHIKISKHLETSTLFFVNWRCGCDSSLLPFFQLSLWSSYWRYGWLCIHKSKEMLCFVLCLFASNSQLCICWMDASEYGEEKPHNQYIVAPVPSCNNVTQNKCFPNLWKCDYIWLICLCARFSGLNPNVAETGCAEFHDCWLHLRSCWEGDRGQALTIGPCELPNNIYYMLLTGLHSW